jgi:uncharacterized membrane protein
MTQSADILLIIRVMLARVMVAVVGIVLIVRGILFFEVAYQATNPVYSAFSSIIEVFVGFALMVLGLSKKPERVLETIADFLGDVLDRIF